jgi:hypothetical protein
MWIVSRYQPITFFSLRSQTATTSGGKSLIVPTPFAVKMALLDATIRTQGVEQGRNLFPAIRALDVAVQPPPWIVVNNTFTKILRLKEIKTKASEKEAALAQAKANQQWPFQSTIAFREYIQFGGLLSLALQGMSLDELAPLLLQINYFGKRGGFFQLQDIPEKRDWSDEELKANSYTLLTEPTPTFPIDGFLQMLDDCGPTMTFDHANIYSGKGIKLGKERILHHVVLPYRLVRSSKSYSYYERID